MKNILTAITLLVVSVNCLAAQVEELRYMVNTINEVNVPIKVISCRVGKPGIIGVEVIDNGSKLRILGQSVGVTDLIVNSENRSKTYRVTVSSNMRETARSITKALESIPTIEVIDSDNKVTLKGEISDINQWSIFQKILPFYKENVINLVTFQPKAEVMLLLQKSFAKAGYTVVRDGSDLKHGELIVTSLGDSLNITGTVYSPEDIKRIERILNAQSWISTKSVTNPAKIRAHLNVEIVPEMLEIGAVYVGFEKSQLEAIGNNFMKAGIPFNINASYGGGIKRNFGPNRGRGSYGISTNLGTVIRLLGENTNSVFRHAGFLSFKSNDTPTFRELHNGGTLKVRVTGNESGTLTDVAYGFILKIKGGLTGKDQVFMEIDVTISTPVLLENGDYDVKKKSIRTTAFCKLDETIALGGLKELLDDTTGHNGLPYLRNIPIINWFVSEKIDTYHDKQTLLLVSPRLMSQARPLEIPPAQELRDVDETAQKQIRKGQKSQRRWYQFFRW